MNAETGLLENTRFDLQVIASWISPGAHVLDLGCGNGDLLYYLKKEKQVHGTGIEQTKVDRLCVRREQRKVRTVARHMGAERLRAARCQMKPRRQVSMPL